MEFINNQTPNPYYGVDQRAVANQTSSVLKRVYVRMFLGLLVSAFTALGVASSQTLVNFCIYNSWVYWGMFIAMIAMAWIIPARLNKMSTGTCLLLFLLFAVLMGASLSTVLLVYTPGSIVATFFICAGMFGAMSVFGFLTKVDLSKFGTYLFMALIGLIIASVVNIFMHSGPLNWIISIAGVLIFTGLTAWDTQQVKRMAAANLEPSMADKLATLGAMSLYLDFINLFLFLLRFVGGSRN